MFLLFRTADILRAAGLTVVEVPGWQTRGHGDLSSLTGIVWHHDASPPGDSPGTVAWLVDGFAEKHAPGDAQAWVDRAGTWHLIAAGKAWHAGPVNDDRWSNSHSLGIETDHTTGEPWEPAQLAALRKGTAAILNAHGLPAAALSFHKTVATPAGRKTDPDGLDLPAERNRVTIQQNALATRPTTSTTTSTTSAPQPAPTGVLRPGDTGSRVASLQTQLNRVFGAYSHLVVDGVYGNATSGVVCEFQRRAGCSVDGVVGPETLAALTRYGVRP